MSYNKKNRKVIFKELIKGNEDAYQTIYFHFYEALCIYILNHTKNRALAEDIAQESLLKLWRKKHTLQSAGALGSFLYRTAYHLFVDHYRKEKYISEELEEFRRESLYELLDDNNEDYKIKLARVKQGIEALPPKCKEIFILSKQQGLSYKEIAKELGITPKTVENQIGKALKSIREKVKNDLFTLLFFMKRNILRSFS